MTLTERDHCGKVSGNSSLEEGLLREELGQFCVIEKKELAE